jgi:hypothetical protein
VLVPISTHPNEQTIEEDLQGREELLAKAKNMFREKGFSVNKEERKSIHNESSRRFMEQVVGAGDWQQQIMKEGLRIEFKDQPGKYTEKNNKSALSKTEVVREKVGEWEALGYVQRLAELAH